MRTNIMPTATLSPRCSAKKKVGCAGNEEEEMGFDEETEEEAPEKREAGRYVSSAMKSKQKESPSPASGAIKKRARRNKRCAREGCTKWARRGGVCVRHRSKQSRPACRHEGCKNYSQKGGFCWRHGAIKCDGCASLAKEGGVCARHGAKRARDFKGGAPDEEDLADSSRYPADRTFSKAAVESNSDKIVSSKAALECRDETLAKNDEAKDGDVASSNAVFEARDVEIDGCKLASLWQLDYTLTNLGTI